MKREPKIKPMSEELLAKVEKAVLAPASGAYVSRSTMAQLLAEVYESTGRAKAIRA